MQSGSSQPDWGGKGRGSCWMHWSRAWRGSKAWASPLEVAELRAVPTSLPRRGARSVCRLDLARVGGM